MLRKKNFRTQTDPKHARLNAWLGFLMKNRFLLKWRTFYLSCSKQKCSAFHPKCPTTSFLNKPRWIRLNCSSQWFLVFGMLFDSENCNGSNSFFWALRTVRHCPFTLSTHLSRSYRILCGEQTQAWCSSFHHAFSSQRSCVCLAPWFFKPPSNYYYYSTLKSEWSYLQSVSSTKCTL